jgi:hypothetical protein
MGDAKADVGAPRQHPLTIIFFPLIKIFHWWDANGSTGISHGFTLRAKKTSWLHIDADL